MDEWHTDHLDISVLLSQLWTENQTGYGISQLKTEWTNDTRNLFPLFGPCYVVLPVQK